MTSQAVEIANRMQSMSDTEIEYLLNFLRQRHANALLDAIDLKLEESKGAASLSEAETAVRLSKMGISWICGWNTNRSFLTIWMTLPST